MNVISRYFRPTLDASPGADYTKVLAGAGYSPMQSIIGIFVALAGYLICVPVVLAAGFRIAWLVSGRSTSYEQFKKVAMGYEIPAGLIVGHIGLGMLILVSVLVFSYVHLVKPKWLCSVQPGMRWRYLLVCLIPAIVLLSAGAWLPMIGGKIEWQVSDHLVWWLLAIVLFTPLQAAGEEFFFRGYLLQGIGSLTPGRVGAVGGSALLFAIFHGTQNLALFVDRFGFGLIVGTLVVSTGGLEAAIAMHVANNVLSFGYACFLGGVAQIRAVQEVTWASCIRDLVVFAALGTICWWIGKKMNVATTSFAASWAKS